MKKLISVCMALMLILACIPVHASADGTPTFAVGTVDAYAGDTVEVPVLIENNPGIIALRVTVSFDTDVLTLQNAESASLFSEGVLTFGGSYATSTFNILWENGTGSNATVNGAFAILTFLVSEDAPEGSAVISISYSASSTFNMDLTEVAFSTANGAVTVQAAENGGWSFTEGCTLYTYESEISGLKFVAGLDTAYPMISDYIETTGGWSFEVEPNEVGMESTGAKLVIYDANGDAVEEYWSIMFGDINGDGVFDGMDITLLTYLIGNVLDEPWADYAVTDEFPQTYAADTNHDFVLDGMDITCLVYQIGNTEQIDQMME